MVRKLLISAVACGALALPATPAAAASCDGAYARPSKSNEKLVREAVLCLLNAERRKRGLSPLRENARLRRAANGHSRNMVSNSFFDHVSPGGGTMTERVRRAGYLRGGKGYSLGENIAWGSGSYATPKRIVRSWMNSPGHKANILRGSFREIGIGVNTGAPVRLHGSQSGATYTTNFGRRH